MSVGPSTQISGAQVATQFSFLVCLLSFLSVCLSLLSFNNISQWPGTRGIVWVAWPVNPKDSPLFSHCCNYNHKPLCFYIATEVCNLVIWATSPAIPPGCFLWAFLFILLIYCILTDYRFPSLPSPQSLPYLPFSSDPLLILPPLRKSGPPRYIIQTPCSKLK